MIFIILTLLFGTLVKSINIKPYSFVLILLGICFGLIYKNIPNNNNYSESLNLWVDMHPHLFLFIFIPPLIYESSFLIDFHIFEKTFKLIMGFTLIGVLLTFGFISLFMYYIDNEYHNSYSLILASILSATDPVAVVSILTELKISEKLITIIEGESLLNDGISIVIFNIILNMILKSPSINNIVIDSVRLSMGGILLGGILTIVKIYWLKHIFNDTISEINLTIAFCYGIYYLSENNPFHTSGILALVTSGLLMSKYGKTRISTQSQQSLHDIWSLLSNISNLVIFTLSGIIIVSKISFNDIKLEHWGILFLLYILLNLIRLLGCLLLYKSFKHNIYHYDIIDFIILVLSGLRGEISLALALFINLENDIPIYIRNMTLFYTSGIVFLSILINSNIINFLIKRYHKDRIMINKSTMREINKHIEMDAFKYLENIEIKDFHMNKVNIGDLKKDILSKINDDDIEENLEERNIVIHSRKVFLETLKKITWNLYEEHILHYDVVMKLINITDNSLDKINTKWGLLMNDYCIKDHINTLEIRILNTLEKYIPMISSLKKYLIYHKIEYNYNLILGYILAQKETLVKVKEIYDEKEIINNINGEINSALELPHSYIDHLEEDYSDILKDIETKQMKLLLISKQKKYLNYLHKNGEINDNIYTNLCFKLDKKEYQLYHS